MSIPCVRQPIILIGMARSGTTLLADLLYRLGLFIGHERILADQEATYFVSVNRTILKRVHGDWDQPAPMRYFLQDKAAVAETVQCMEKDLRSCRIIEYLGWKRYLRYRSLERYDRPWGWKDPRNVFTLPLWLRLFPQAKIVYIVRNGVDVASSLAVMERRVVARRRERARKSLTKRWSQPHLERAGFKGAVRCLSLEGGFSLWEEYVAQAEETLATIDNERRVLRFENLLAEPKAYLSDLFGFCGLESVSATALAEAAEKINGQRASAFLTDPVLCELYEKVRTSRWMVHYGYSNITGT